MTDTVLMRESALAAIDFADSMIGDHLWTAGRGKERERRFSRVRTLVALGESLRIEIIVRENAGKPVAFVEQHVTEIALELSELARAAVADGTLKTRHFDPWRLTHVVESDAFDRERGVRAVAA